MSPISKAQVEQARHAERLKVGVLDEFPAPVQHEFALWMMQIGILLLCGVEPGRHSTGGAPC